MSAVRTWILGLSLLGGLAWAAVSQGQQPVTKSSDLRQFPPSKAGTVGYGAQPGQLWSFARQDSSHQTAQLAQQYVKATKEDEKKEIKKKLTDILNQQFDQRIQQQQKELEDLEKQIASLRTLLKKRTDAKTTIVERRIDQLVQEAEGLGWTSPAGVHAPNPFGAGYGGFGGFSGGGAGRFAPGETTPKPKTP